jgi:patatin-like phospholipase/acyl hydrolase
VDGSKQKYGIHYDETYSPVVQWSSTRFLLIQALLNNWYTHQIDFVLAYAQAPVERELYMEIPKGVNLESADCKDYVLKLLKNLYGQKQAGRVWYNHLVNGLFIAQQMNVSSIITAASYLSMLMIQFFWDQMEKS